MSIKNPFKNSALELASSLSEQLNAKVKPAHAHDLLAASFGYRSKKAFVDDFDFDDTSDKAYEDYVSIWSRSYQVDQQTIRERIGRMKESPLSSAPFFTILNLIEKYQTPLCYECHEHVRSPEIINDNEQIPFRVVCADCLNDDFDEQYDYCKFCDEYYLSSEIKNGECETHRGESHMDEEERQGWDDYIENINKY